MLIRASFVFALAVLVAACKGESPASSSGASTASSAGPSAPSAPRPAASAAASAQPAAAAPARVVAENGPLVLAPPNQLRWSDAPIPTTDVAAAVREAYGRATEDGRTLIVYVGATWCEPCQRFHHAVERGELDAAFPKLTVLAFDADRDSEALATAGYVSRLIPLFALPRPDGRASGRTIEGSVKGAEAVGEITPRLRALIANRE